MAEQVVKLVVLKTQDELQEAVELQKVYWGSNIGDLVPLHMLFSLANYGGHVFGARVDGRLVGLLIGFLGADIQADDALLACERLCVMSKRMVVLPEYRNLKIGEKLKWAQREFALRHGIQLVSWTFDPLLSRNAYLNLHKLRAVGQTYVLDYFGTNATNPTLSADRLVVNWWVRHARVDAPLPSDYSDAQLLNAVSDGLPTRLCDDVTGDAVLLQIPADFLNLAQVNPDILQIWRDHVRAAFLHVMGAGYIASDFLRRDGASFYVFTRDDGSYTFQKD